MLKPGTPAPDLQVETVGGGMWRLSDQTPETFTIIDFYRGYHCPRCKVHLLDLDHKIARFTERGCGVIAISMDPADRAEKVQDDWGIHNLTLGYGLREETARAWGLYISDAFQTKETALFSEPGLMLIRPDGTVYSCVYNSTPFFRSHYADVMEAIDMIRARDYPPRGTV